ncbi:MAG: nucleotidyl transferase AbiEii/AbiGii toxin family protein [Acidimicrobiales bacterium]
MLSALQRRVAIVLADLPEAEGFALAGGGALIVRGAVDRETRDLDFFVGEADAVDRLLPALEAALTAGHLAVERRQVAHGFARLSVTAGDDHTEVDLCVDYRLLPTEPSPVGPTLSLEELAANKLLALFSRAEARDFVDFAALEPVYGLEHLCRLAADKDAGFDRTVLAEMLGRVDRIPDDELLLDQQQLASLRHSVLGWRLQLARPAPGRGRGRER